MSSDFCAERQGFTSVISGRAFQSPLSVHSQLTPIHGSRLSATEKEKDQEREWGREHGGERERRVTDKTALSPKP